MMSSRRIGQHSSSVALLHTYRQGTYAMDETVTTDARSEDDLSRRSFGVRPKSINEETRTIRFRASDPTIDSYNEIVEQDWDLSRFEKNAPFLYNHNRGPGFFGEVISQAETLPVGFARSAELVDGALEVDVQFVDGKASPLAPYVWEAYRQGSLKAVSVGFRHGEKVLDGEQNGKKVYRLRKNQLFELSAVPLPANPNAVALSADAPLTRAVEAPELRQDPAPEVQPEANHDLDMARAESAALRERLDAANHAFETLQSDLRELTAKHAGEKVKLDQRLDATDKKLRELEQATIGLALSLTDPNAKGASGGKAIELAKEELSRSRKEFAELCVRSLVGRKIVPSEVPGCVDDFLKDRKNFEERIALRADLRLTERVIQPEGLRSSPAAHLAPPQKTGTAKLVEKHQRHYYAR